MLKKQLLAGLLILLPVVLTILIINFLFEFFTAPILTPAETFVFSIQKRFDLVLPLGFAIFLARLVALLAIVLLVFILGIFARHFLLKRILQWGNQLLCRVPIIRGIYKILRDVFSALFSQDGRKQVFKEPVLVPFPDRSSYSLGFCTGDAPDECQKKAKDLLVSVFAPTAPHPISGFLFLVPKKEVRSIEITSEDAIKFIVSCGMILPQDKP